MLAAPVLPLLAVAAPPPPGTVAELHIVNRTAFPLAAALDGSPYAFYLRRATSAAASSRWLLFHQGGDLCGVGDSRDAQLADCAARARTPLGSSDSWARQPTLDLRGYNDLFDDSPVTNPLMHDWNWVYLLYLDGAYYAGTVPDAVEAPDGTPLYFRGAANVAAALRSLPGFAGRAADVVVGGCSSGGIAVLANADHLRPLVAAAAAPAAPAIAGFVDSGYYLNEKTGWWTKAVYSLQRLAPTLNQACQRANPDSPWDCIVGDVVGPYIQSTPMFAWQSRYDTNQLIDCEGISRWDAAGQDRYGAQLQAGVEAWVRRSGDGAGPRHAAFVDGCSRHCGSSVGIAAAPVGSPGAAKVAPKVAFASWYNRTARGLGENATWVQEGGYPCRSCCAHAVE